MSTQEGPSPSAKASNATMIRQIVLIGVLIIVGGAAAYDRMSARPAAELAYQRIIETADARIGTSEPPLNSDDVQKIVGKAPTSTKMGPNKYVEKYSWTAGLPWRSYWIWAVYSPLEQKSIDANKKPLFEMHFLNEPLPEECEPDLVLERQFAPPPSEPIGAGMSGGGGGRARRPPGGSTPPGEDPAKAAKEKPAEEQPATDKPAEDKPATDKPAEDKPATDNPAEDKPATDKPAEDKPATDKPPENKPPQ